MKKFGILLASLVLLFVACDGTTNINISHEHTYSNEWTSDETHHWHKATCSHRGEVSGKAEHTWNDGVVTTEPTETATGVKTLTCTVCEAKKTETLPVINGGGQEQPHEHTYADSWTSDDDYHWKVATCTHDTPVTTEKVKHNWKLKNTKDATCIANGEKSYECNVCKKTKSETIASEGHKYGDFVTTKEATETEEGSKKRTCSVCGNEDIEVIPQIGHEHTIDKEHWSSDETNHWHDADCNIESHDKDKAAHIPKTETTVPATCTTAGKEETTCSVCGYKISETTLPATGHTYAKEWSKDANNHWHVATCGHDVTSEKIAHNWALKSTTNVTCTTDGSNEYECTVCKATKTEKIDALGHNFETAWSSDDDNHWHKCTRCNGKADEAAHGWGDAVIATRPTSTKDGEETYTCVICSKSKTVTIPKGTVIVANKTQELVGSNDDASPDKIIFDNIPVSVSAGDEIQFTITISGADNYVQMGLQSDIDYTVWRQIWEDDGITGIRTFTTTINAKDAASSILMQCVFKLPLKNGVTTSVTISNIRVINLTKANEEPVVVPPADGKYTFTPDNTSSKKMAMAMAMGWNLGNFLDSTAGTPAYCGESNGGLGVETGWRGTGYVTEAMITTVHSAGFKSIRIPVSWHNHITDESNFTIDAQWMNRVKEVVDWAYNQDMCVIINVHHDNIRNDTYGHYNSETKEHNIRGYAVSTDSTQQNLSKDYLEKVWTQIANTFKNYDNKLVFEVLNEPRAVGTDKEWGFYGGDASSQEIINLNNVITSYEKTCIDAIRATGGNNETRYLVVPAYAGSFNNCDTYNLPQDSANDKLIFSFHAYSPQEFAMYPDYDPSKNTTVFNQSCKDSLNGIFAKVRNKFGYDIGIIIGEASADNKGNLSDREKWFTHYFGTAYYDYYMPTFLWDNGVYSVDGRDVGSDNKLWDGERHGYLNVQTQNSWHFPTLIENARKAIYGN